MLFSCLKRKLKEEIKVAQLAGYVAEHSCYHHGEVCALATFPIDTLSDKPENRTELLLN